MGKLWDALGKWFARWGRASSGWSLVGFLVWLATGGTGSVLGVLALIVGKVLGLVQADFWPMVLYVAGVGFIASAILSIVTVTMLQRSGLLLQFPPGASVFVKGPDGMMVTREIMPASGPSEAEEDPGTGDKNVEELQNMVVERDRKIELMSVRIKFADTSEKMLKDQITDKDREIEEHNAVVERLSAERRAAQAEVAQLMEVRWYGEPLLRVAKLSEADYAVMVTQIAELKPSLDRLHGTADAFWYHLSLGMRSKGPDSSEYWLSKLVHGQSFMGFDSACAELQNVLDNTTDDPRPYLVLVYRKHTNFKRWMDCLFSVQTILSAIPSRNDWIAATGDFEKELEKKAGSRQMRDVRLAIENCEKEQEAKSIGELLKLAE